MSHVQGIVCDVYALLLGLWSLESHASGHGISDPKLFLEEFGGPFPGSSVVAHHLFSSKVPFDEVASPDWQKVVGDKIIWVHTDLRMHNVLVDNQWRFCGLVDWENSAWCRRYWQIAVLRQGGYGCQGEWLHARRDVRFDVEAEGAYDAMLKFVLCRF
ncbi:hypothetical protein AURDEDRAFT_157425 [Auricularia subglabra TFB-10046 SS5]|nr:hypothetical protein AURDEDRAFT_157425 [Auricularia subglabra TFB-10046 SS5]